MHVVATCLGLLLVVHLLARSLTFVSLAFLTVEVLVFLGWHQAPVGSKRQQQSRRVDLAAVQPSLLHWDREELDQAAPGMERGDVLSHPPDGWGKCEGTLQS